MYGGALSAAGAQIRNAGDSIAQAAASCRFKTGLELVTDELRESGTCWKTAYDKLKNGVEEVSEGKREILGEYLFFLLLLVVYEIISFDISYSTLHTVLTSNTESSLQSVMDCGDALERAGAAILQRQTIGQVGSELVQASLAMAQVATMFAQIDNNQADVQLASQRLTFAADKMKEAGESLQGIKPVVKGKAWLKGG
jgi:hypothetical protein